MPTTILTDIAEAKITQAAGSGSQVAIMHVALGDGNGASYIGEFDQTGLRRERVRVPIERRHIVSPSAWRVKAEFGADTLAFDVREAGFFDAEAGLIIVDAPDDDLFDHVVVDLETQALTYSTQYDLQMAVRALQAAT